MPTAVAVETPEVGVGKPVSGGRELVEAGAVLSELEVWDVTCNSVSSPVLRSTAVGLGGHTAPAVCFATASSSLKRTWILCAANAGFVSVTAVKLPVTPSEITVTPITTAAFCNFAVHPSVAASVLPRHE